MSSTKLGNYSTFLVELVRMPDDPQALATVANADRLKKSVRTLLTFVMIALGISILERFMAINCVIPNTHAKVIG